LLRVNLTEHSPLCDLGFTDPHVKNVIHKFILLAAALSVSFIAAPAFSNTLELGCRLAEDNNKPDIWFSGVTGGNFDPGDYAETGNMSVTAVVSGNGQTAEFLKQLNYKKVGNRLETDQVWITLPVTMEEFKTHFGLFPTLTCTSP